MVEVKALGFIITGFVAMIVGLALIPSIGDSVQGTRVTADISGEALTIASGTGTTANDDVTTLINFSNASITYTDFVTGMNGSINFTGSTGVFVVGGNISNGAYVTAYTYEPSTYVKDSASRNLMPLLTLFFAIGVMAVGAFMVFKGFQGVM